MVRLCLCWPAARHDFWYFFPACIIAQKARY
jgi:hypothetical protein